MISLFRKHLVMACLAALATALAAQAQVATRTQLSTERSGGVLSLTAQVDDVQGQPVTEGSVSFETTKGSLGSVFVHDGVATLNLTNPPAWAKSVTAVYHGDTSFANSNAVTAVTSNAATALPGFTVTASPSSLTLPAGQYGTVNLTITSQNGFSEAVNLSCSGLPGASTCNFNPVVATPKANGSVISAMQITTMARSGSASQGASLRTHSNTTYALVVPGLLALAGLGALRRRNFAALRVVGVLMLLGAGTFGLTSCAARYNYLHYKPAPNYGTPAGNFTIVVSAYSTNGTAITQATSSDPNCAGAVCVALTVQ